MKATADQIIKAGGVSIGDGVKARMVIEHLGGRCSAEEGINALRRIVSQPDAINVNGPTCSNVPSEAAMYKSMFHWVASVQKDFKTVWGGVEKDFAHSNATYNIMKDNATKAGLDVTGQSEWLLADTSFATQVREIKRANADVVAISAHPFTICGVRKEMQCQGVKPKMLIGLTSSSSMETLQGCAQQAEGIFIPTSFAPVTPEAKAAAHDVRAVNANMDLHDAAACENMFVLKEVIERQKIMGKPETSAADRVKIREGLASLKQTAGLLGPVNRDADREAIKPFLFVQAKNMDCRAQALRASLRPAS